MFWPKACIFALVTAAAVLPAHAQWKWRDARGQVHVSDMPPPRDVPAKDILQQPAAAMRRTAAPAPVAPAAAASDPAGAASAAVAGKPRVEPELEARRKAADQDKAAKSKVEEDRQAAARADNCQRAREQAQALESGMRVARVNAKGEREFLDDKARADELVRARQVMSSECR